MYQWLVEGTGSVALMDKVKMVSVEILGTRHFNIVTLSDPLRAMLNQLERPSYLQKIMPEMKIGSLLLIKNRQACDYKQGAQSDHRITPCFMSPPSSHNTKMNVMKRLYKKTLSKYTCISYQVRIN